MLVFQLFFDAAAVLRHGETANIEDHGDEDIRLGAETGPFRFRQNRFGGVQNIIQRNYHDQRGIFKSGNQYTHCYGAVPVSWQCTGGY